MREERIGEARLILGDCRELLSTLAFDVIVSDPPYGIAYRHSGGGRFVSNMGPDAGRCFARHQEDIGGDAEPFDPSHLVGLPCVLFGANHFYARLPDGGTFHVWDKHCGRGTDDSFSDAEFFWTSWRRKSECIRYLWKGVLQDGEKGERRHHPSQKPIVVMESLVRMAPGRVVCDPYMGSGSTILACVRLGRPSIGIEIESRYFDIACRRIEAAHRQADLFVPPPTPEPEQAALPLEAAA